MTTANIDTKKLREISEEALSLHDLLNDKQVEWIKREVAKDRFDTVEALLLAQQAKIEGLEKEIELRKLAKYEF